MSHGEESPTQLLYTIRGNYWPSLYVLDIPLILHSQHHSHSLTVLHHPHELGYLQEFTFILILILLLTRNKHIKVGDY